MKNPRCSPASATKLESLQRQMILFSPWISLFICIMAALNPRGRVMTKINRAEFLPALRRNKLIILCGNIGSNAEDEFPGARG